MSDKSQPLSAAERKRRQRARERADGWTSVTVRVPAEKVEELRAFAESLGVPTAGSQQDIPGQQLLF